VPPVALLECTIEMAQLHLPSEHSTEDLVLAHRVATAVESEELYVAWSHRAGAGQQPAIRARVREEPNVLVEAVTTVLGWLASVLDALAGPTGTTPRTARPAQEPPRRRPPRSHPAA
jgi:hypothetical protein